MSKPFTPQPIAVLKSRFFEALENSYSVAHVKQNPAERPGDKPEHIFDSETGLRLIVSRDHHEGKEFMHLSASIDDQYYKKQLIQEIVLNEMLELFYELLGSRPVPVQILYVSR